MLKIHKADRSPTNYLPKLFHNRKVEKHFLKVS